jgi:hypothetical protein
MTATCGVAGSPVERVSDASVAFDAKRGVWLASSIPQDFGTLVIPTVLINRSTDGGWAWSGLVSIPPPAVAAHKVNLDKNWTACDDTPSSPFYGNCYRCLTTSARTTSST